MVIVKSPDKQKRRRKKSSPSILPSRAISCVNLLAYSLDSCVYVLCVVCVCVHVCVCTCVHVCVLCVVCACMCVCVFSFIIIVLLGTTYLHHPSFQKGKSINAGSTETFRLLAQVPPESLHQRATEGIKPLPPAPMAAQV